jgi:hypothetical protein
VVDTKAGVVQYDGKVEMINRLEPSGPFSQSFTFEPSAGDADTILTLFGSGKTPTFTAAGKFKLDEDSSATLAKSLAANVSRSVLEDAYVELQAVTAALEDAGVETIPPSAGVRDLIRRNDFEHSARTAYEQRHNEENEAARAEMISFVKRAHAKKIRLQTAAPDGDGRRELDDRWRGMLDVLAKFLVITGEADADEGHAVARKLCGIDDE